MVSHPPDPPWDVLNIPPPGSCWFVVHTRPRCEKKAADFCRQEGIAVYLPLQTRIHHYGNRARAFSSPLFPGYVFCLAEQVKRSLLQQNRYVANLLLAIDQKGLVEQLRQIRRALEAGDVVEVLPYLEAGKRVCVRGGPFKGLEGVILRVKGKTRVVVNVDMIQQAVAVDVDSAYLVPA